MERLLRIIILCLFRIPGFFFKLVFYGNHADEFSDEFKHQVLRNMAKPVCKAGRINVDVQGLQNIPKKSGYMLYPNHQGMFDVIAMLAGFTAPFSVVYKKELKNVILIRHAFKMLGAKAIDRSDLRQSMGVINEVSEEVKQGRNYVIFAEGTRNRDKNNVHAFKPGSFKIAMKAKCPVVPVAQIDMYKALDDKGTSPITVQIHILPPINYEEYKHMKTSELAEKVQKQIRETIDKFE